MQFASGCIFPQAEKYWHQQEHWMCWTCLHQPEKPLSSLLLVPSSELPTCTDGANSVPLRSLLSRGFTLCHFPQISAFFICCFLMSSLPFKIRANQLHQNQPKGCRTSTAQALGKWSITSGNNVKAHLHYCIIRICRSQQRWYWQSCEKTCLGTYTTLSFCCYFFLFSLLIGAVVSPPLNITTVS